MIEQIKNAFQHFIDNVYENLETSAYKRDLRFYVGRFKKKGLNNGDGSLGTTKALQVLGDFGYSLGEYPDTDAAIAIFKEKRLQDDDQIEESPIVSIREIAELSDDDEE